MKKFSVTKTDIKFNTRLRKDFTRNKSLYLMFIPVLIYFAVFCYGPMYGILMAFQDYSPRKGITGSEWVAFENFTKFFNSPSFWPVLRNTLKISFATILFGFPAPILLALLLNEIRSVKLGRIVQNITYLPHFISLVVVCGMVTMFTSDTGFIGMAFNAITGNKGNMLGNPDNFLPIYVVSNIWKEVGWGSIIYLSALLSIDDSLYEAAEIDGAGRWKQTIHITLPGILPTIMIMLIMRMGQVLGVGYEKVLLLQNDANIDVSEVISTYVYKRGLVKGDFSYSSAVALFNTFVNLIFLGATNMLSKKLNDTSLW